MEVEKDLCALGDLTYERFVSCLDKRPGGLGEYRLSTAPRLFRIARNLYACRAQLSGPILDIGSGEAVLYPFFKEFLPGLLPYTPTEVVSKKITFNDGDIVEAPKFECEVDRLPFDDNSFGLVMFNDVLEHLIVDPMWALLEFNRVLRNEGNLAISTPNAASIERVTWILQGRAPMTERSIKPTAIYDRHNREWTIDELQAFLSSGGFTFKMSSTSPELLTDIEKGFLELFQTLKLVERPDFLFGPELFVLGEKHQHITLDSEMSKQDRWPVWLYSHRDAYRQRPKPFPIIGDLKRNKA